MKSPPTSSPRSIAVVFDSNPIFKLSSTELIRHECLQFIRTTKPTHITISWYLPDVVWEERIFQMQKEALGLSPHISKLESILGHSLNASESELRKGVERLATEIIDGVGIKRLRLDTGSVDWPKIVINATRRIPPFDPEKEKGFRDAMIAESFFQLHSDPSGIYDLFVLVTQDGLLKTAIAAMPSQDIRIVPSISELATLVNTLEADQDEQFIKMLVPMAAKIFFLNPNDETGLYYTGHVRDLIKQQYAVELKAVPDEGKKRRNIKWLIATPSFLRKSDNEITWKTKLNMKAVAYFQHPRYISLSEMRAGSEYRSRPIQSGNSTIFDFWKAAQAGIPQSAEPDDNFMDITTHEGIDNYSVIWTTRISGSGPDTNLTDPRIVEVLHEGVTWKPLLAEESLKFLSR